MTHTHTQQSYTLPPRFFHPLSPSSSFITILSQKKGTSLCFFLLVSTSFVEWKGKCEGKKHLLCVCVALRTMKRGEKEESIMKVHSPQ
jgi:hypothetical protein